MSERKRCMKCRKNKKLECYSKHKNNWDGYQIYCKDCQAKYFQSYWPSYRKRRNELRSKKSLDAKPALPVLPPNL